MTDDQNSMDYTDNVEMGPLQLAVTWYKIHHAGEQAIRTGTSTTKKMQICLHEVALFWMSQWTACSPAAKGPLNLVLTRRIYSTVG